jgi:hypothetical protein
MSLFILYKKFKKWNKKSIIAVNTEYQIDDNFKLNKVVATKVFTNQNEKKCKKCSLDRTTLMN